MANTIPASLKSADIGRFAVRAAQIERAKPVVAYWCNFWIVNQIIERGLHTSDDEVKHYTTTLVDKLEQFKTENADNDTVMDSVAANAYVEQFGLEVFGRAEATMRANKVTKQTADTLQAAATFLELCQIWNPPDAEFAAKIKFAKYHALRIVKAIKAGEDPNASNPVLEQQEDNAGVDPDAQVLDEADIQQAMKPRQASVEEVPDDTDRIQRQMARQSSLDESLHPSRSSSIPPQHQPAVSPSHDAGPAPDQAMDVDSDQSAALNLPSAPQTIGQPSSQFPILPDTPGTIGAPRSSDPSHGFQSFPPPSTGPPQSPPAPSFDPSSFYDKPSAPAPSFTHPPSAPIPPAVPHPAPMAAPAPPSAAASSNQLNPQSVDDDAIAQAQKHARWAVSALSFDDVTTAIKELKASLRHLGAE